MKILLMKAKCISIHIYNIVMSFLISLSSVYIFTFLLLKCKFIYGLYLSKTDFSNSVSISKDKILENYSILCDFISSPFEHKLVLPDFNISHNSMIHFYDVKNIMTILLLLTIVTLFILILQFIFTSHKNRKSILCFLLYVPIGLILFCSLLTLSFAINFRHCFTLFHKLLFRNDFWLFDPEIDPIINILPEDLFLMAALIILSCLVLESILLLVIRKYLLKISNHSTS